MEFKYFTDPETNLPVLGAQVSWYKGKGKELIFQEDSSHLTAMQWPFFPFLCNEEKKKKSHNHFFLIKTIDLVAGLSKIKLLLELIAMVEKSTGVNSKNLEVENNVGILRLNKPKGETPFPFPSSFSFLISYLFCSQNWYFSRTHRNHLWRNGVDKPLLWWFRKFPNPK